MFSAIAPGRPMLYVDPEGEIYRTSKVKAVSTLDYNRGFSVRARNSEYILLGGPASDCESKP